MSDTLILGLAALIATTVVTPIIAYLIKRSEKKILDRVEKTNTKVDDYHKETNSKLSQLVVAEKGVSFAEGEKQGRADQIISDKEKQPTVTYDTEKPTEVEGKGIKKDLTQAKEKIDQAKKKLDEI